MWRLCVGLIVLANLFTLFHCAMNAYSRRNETSEDNKHVD
jgi:hypothetical protein